jgi:hypothetical protein
MLCVVDCNRQQDMVVDYHGALWPTHIVLTLVKLAMTIHKLNLEKFSFNMADIIV